MSSKKIDKNFLYLLILSVIMHLALYTIISLMPPAQGKPEQGPTMVDLTELPELAELPKPEPKPPTSKPEPKKPVPKEQRPIPLPSLKQAPVTKQAVPQSPRPVQPGQPSQAEPAPPQQSAPVSRKAEPSVPAQETGQTEPVTRGQGIFKPKSGGPIERSKLFPSAGKLARLEDSYRKKFEQEIERGDTSFLNSDDIRFGSFLRRFESAVYGVWHYPEAALARGIEGTTPVRITFNRSGEIVHVELLESSGSGILDAEVMRTLKQLGPIGSFPKGYSGNAFKLIAFFQYGISGGRLR
jgi:protein TonB